MIPKSIGSSGDIITKRMTIPNGTVVATAGSVVAVTTYSCGLVQSNPASEWASFAARYQQFRVQGMKMTLLAILPVNTAANTMCEMYYSDFIGTALPTTVAQVLSDENGVVKSSGKDHVITVSWARNPNAKLWNPTSAALPAANAFGVALCSSTYAGFPAAGTVFTYSLEFLIELRGSQ